ncbi:MAG: pro-sigmaK processing inhibitor BofA family protein [Halobacteria archaeon]|nr:pro-sigmaK processing inhibitor BofA family protein [Halobacteria archaeon]
MAPVPVIEIAVLGLVVVALALVILRFSFEIARKLIYNSIIGLILLFLINLTPFVSVPYSLLAILIIAVGGVPGVVLVVLLHLMGIAFVPAVLFGL